MPDLDLLKKQAQHLVDLAKQAGADACDVVVASGNSYSVGVREGKIEKSKRSESDSLNLRVFCGKKIATVASNTTSNLQMLAERAVAMARVSPEDPFQGLVDPELLFDQSKTAEVVAKLDVHDTSTPDSTTMEQMALEAESAGLSTKGISKSMGAGFGWSKSGFVLATSSGFSASYERTGSSMQAIMLAGDGTNMERDYAFDQAVYFSDLKSPEEIGILAAERTIRKTGSIQSKSGKFPVIYDPRVSSMLLSALLGAINGASVARKTSFLRDAMGERITKEGIDVVDDPHRVRRVGSKPFDGEGVATQARELVTDGILQSWILDSASARELSLTTNGMAGRGGTGTHPTTSNCYIKPGNITRDSLISSIPEGLYLTETIGHGTNMVTGDYSKGAAGYWIKNGELTHPVSEITVAGNLKDMFQNMTAADDLEYFYGVDAPTLLVEGMTIGGN